MIVVNKYSDSQIVFYQYLASHTSHARSNSSTDQTHTFPFPPLIGLPCSNGAALTCGVLAVALNGKDSLCPPPSFPLPYCALGGGAR